MNLIELNRALRQLRLGGIAAVLETRIHQAQAEAMPPIDFLSCLVSDELTRRGDRLLPTVVAVTHDHQVRDGVADDGHARPRALVDDARRVLGNETAAHQFRAEHTPFINELQQLVLAVEVSVAIREH